MRKTNVIRAVVVALGLMTLVGAGFALSPSAAQGTTPPALPEGASTREAALSTILASAPDSLGAARISQWTLPNPLYRITLQADGLYALTYSDLASAGLPVGTPELDPRTIRVFWMDQEVAIQVLGEGDGSFDPDDVVLFYGRGVDSLFRDGLLPTNRYTGTSTFFLTYDPNGVVSGLRMADKDGTPGGDAADPFLQTVHLEQNREYFAAFPFEHDADHWVGFWIQCIAATPGYRNYTFTANNVASGAYTGTLTVKMLGFTAGPHHLNVYVNGNQVLDGSPTWFGFQDYETTVDVPQAYFLEGSNTIRVEMVNTGGKFVDKVYVNWVEPGYVDTYVAEGNVLAFGSPPLGTNYEVSNFSSDNIQVYDVTDMTAVQVFSNT
ncbi:MAG TPA: hypothetical protein VM537_23020, partial [Anaerolineae bacterium]|nr:hypothetical protein [Anaerolineae bacterium]